jgi:hypothetical protein
VDILVVLHEAGQAIDVEPVLRGIDLEPLFPEDWVKVMNLRGISHFDHERYAEATEVLTSAYERRAEGQRMSNGVTAIYLAKSWWERGDRVRAIEILRQEAERLNDDNVMHHLAVFLWDDEQTNESLRVFRELAYSQHRRRKYVIGYARRLKRYGSVPAMLHECDRVLSKDEFGLPQSTEAFYYCGFANYLLVRYDRAEYDRSRGLQHSSQRYETIDE